MENKQKKRIDFKTFMLMVWVFIKALVIPKYAYRFRNMYLIFPIILLIISWVILPIPIQTYMARNGRSEFQKQNVNNVNMLYNITDDAYDAIKALGIRFDLKIMYVDDVTIDGKENVIEEGNDKLYIVVDLVEEDQIKGAETHYDFINFFDTYVNEEGINTLLVLYNSKYLIRSNNPNHKFSNYYEYNMDTFKVADVSKDDFANFLTDGMINVIINTYGWYAALYTLIIPLALTLFCFIIFKSTSRIKRFKNYLNVAGICAIAPSLLIFIFSWIFPMLSLIQYYVPVYIAYYFFFVAIISFKKDKVIVVEDIKKDEPKELEN